MSAQPNVPAPDTTPAIPTSGTPPPAGSEEAALLDLHAHDPQIFEYAPWRDSGVSGSQRLFEIQQARTAQQEAAEKTGEVADQSDDLVDADDIDLDAQPDDAGEAGEADEPAEGAEAEQTEERTALEPWTPPEGQEIAEYAKPHLEELDGIATDEKQRDEIVGLYQKLVEEQTARLAEVNKSAKSETVASLKSELGDGFAAYRDQVDAAFNALSKQDRAELKSARLADGRLLLNTKVGIELLHQLGAKPAATGHPQDQRTAMQEEVAAIDALMAKDVGELYKPWRNTGMSASDRRLQIMRQMDAPAPKPSAAALKSEEAELLALYGRDPMVFQYTPNWKGTNQTAADRLHQIRSGRA